MHRRLILLIQVNGPTDGPGFCRTGDPLQPLKCRNIFIISFWGFHKVHLPESIANGAGERKKRNRWGADGMKDQQILGHSCSRSGSLRHFKGKKEMGKHKHIIKPRSQLTRPIPAIPKSHLAAHRIITCCRFKTSRCCQLFMITVIYTVPLVCLVLGSHVQMRANLSPEKIPN